MGGWFEPVLTDVVYGIDSALNLTGPPDEAVIAKAGTFVLMTAPPPSAQAENFVMPTTGIAGLVDLPIQAKMAFALTDAKKAPGPLASFTVGPRQMTPDGKAVYIAGLHFPPPPSQ